MMYLAAIAVLASAKRPLIETMPQLLHECEQKGNKFFGRGKRLECNGFKCEDLFGKDCRQVWNSLKALPVLGSHIYKNCRFERILKRNRWKVECRSGFEKLKKGCPLNPKITCKGVKAVEDTKTRVAQMLNVQAWFGVKYDLIARAGDQVAFDLECPKGSNAPFAVHASNGMFVRFMATRNSAWQVADLAVKDLRKIGCNRKLRPITVEEALKKRNLQEKYACPGHKKFSKKCGMVPATLALWPSSVDVLEKDVQMMFSLSVSSMKFWNRALLKHPKTMAVMYMCKGQKPRLAWKNLQLLTDDEILILVDETKDFSQTGLIKLTQRTWKDRCA